MDFPYDLIATDDIRLGLVVLQTDETIEHDLRHLIPAHINLLVTRIPSGDEVTQDTLGQMARDLPAAAKLLPKKQKYAAVGYGCTSGAAVIGPNRVGDLVRSAVSAEHVTNPVTALLAACAALKITRLAILSPYVASVSDHLRKVLDENGISTPHLGSFNEAIEEKVVRIAPDSILSAAKALARQGDIDALFMSCTNLRALDLIAPLESELNLPVLSSNQVIAWHLLRLAGIDDKLQGYGRLFNML